MTDEQLPLADVDNLNFIDPPKIIWIPVREALKMLWSENPKLHDIGALIQSIDKYGFQELPRFDINLVNVQGSQGAIKAGNGRIEALALMEKDRMKLPRGLAEDKATAMWVMPILAGTDAESMLQAQAYAIDTNNLTMSGGDFTAYDMSKLWDTKFYFRIGERLAAGDELPLTLDAETLETLQYALTQYEQKQPKLPPASEGYRTNQAVDIIFTHTFRSSCCIAVQSGFKYGLRSIKEPCPYSIQPYYYDAHKVTFVDVDFMNYKHDVHLETVKRFRPKYATVMDIFSKKQAIALGIPYNEFEKVMDWARELKQYAENVILIPKYECLDKIDPEEFMLGYSIPTTHGGTDVPAERFKGYRVHLLGGSLQQQTAYLELLGASVKSLDNNYISKMAMYGAFYDHEGKVRKLSDIGLTELSNPLYCAFVLCCGSFMRIMNRIGVDTAPLGVTVEEGDFSRTDET